MPQPMRLSGEQLHGSPVAVQRRPHRLGALLANGWMGHGISDRKNVGIYGVQTAVFLYGKLLISGNLLI